MKSSLDLPTQEFIANSLANGGDYFEWGCGASTLFAAKLTKNDLVSVENDPIWAELVQRELSDLNEITAKTTRLELIDLGPIRKWGYPELTISREQAESYYRSPFLNFLKNRNDSKHLTVLIDGRFRKSCALTVLMEKISNFSLIIDDADNRPHLVDFANKIGGYGNCGRAHVWQSSIKIEKSSLARLQNECALDPR